MILTQIYDIVKFFYGLFTYFSRKNTTMTGSVIFYSVASSIAKLLVSTVISFKFDETSPSASKDEITLFKGF